jgi:hypothetical protein
MNQNLVGSIYGRFSIKMLISSRFVNKHGHHRQFLFLIGRFLKIFFPDQISVHLGKRFQRRRFFFKKSTNQKQEWPVAAMFVNKSGRNEQSLQRTFHRCFLPSFGSFSHAVSEEKIKKKNLLRNH